MRGGARSGPGAGGSAVGHHHQSERRTAGSPDRFSAAAFEEGISRSLRDPLPIGDGGWIQTRGADRALRSHARDDAAPMTMGLSSVKERQKQHWDAVAPRLGTWPEWTERNLQPMTSRLQQLTGPPARVLDVGCGAGYPALVLARAGGRFLATDLSRQMIGVASKQARHRRRDNIRFRPDGR